MSGKFFAGLPEHLQPWGGDPAMRPVPKTERQQLLEEIKRLRAAVDQSNQRIDVLLEWIKRWAEIKQ